MPGVYRVELATSNRAGCQNTECKNAGVKIPKGMLRFGTFATFGDYQSWKWKHWGCVTPKQIINLKQAIEDNVDLLDGYEDLDEDIQEKIKKSLEDGHIPDDEWIGDVEMNRPGMNGFRTPASKKTKKDEAKAAMAAEEDGSPSPSKAQADKKPDKKRGRAHDEAEIKAEMDSAPAKKSKAASKNGTKAKKVKQEDADSVNGNSGSEPVPKKKGTKAAKVKQEDVDSVDIDIARGVVPKKKGRGRAIKAEGGDVNSVARSHIKPGQKATGKAKEATKEEANDKSRRPAPPTKKAWGKAKATEEDNTKGAVEKQAAPIEKGRGKAKNKEAGNDAEADVKDKENGKVLSKKGRKKSAKEDADDEDEDDSAEAEAEIEGASQPKKGRKGSQKKAVTTEMPTRFSGRAARKNYNESEVN